jgi:DNA-binding response OmpR family regulator
MKTLTQLGQTGGYQHIQVIGGDASIAASVAACLQLARRNIDYVDRAHYRHWLSPSIDLLVLDIDNLSLDTLSSQVFLATCFTPVDVPILLVTTRQISETVRDRYLSSGVLDVVRLKNTAQRPVTA